MLIQDVKKLDPFQRLCYWIKERESIRIKKEGGKPWPWTDDEILSNYRFCNVRRMDDRVSQWLLNHWYTPYKDHPNMLLACALARYINLPLSLELIGFPRDWEPGRIKRQLTKVAETGCVFNAAYIICADATAAKGTSKIETVIDRFVGPLRGWYLDTESMQVAHYRLMQCHGFGSFMAGQVVADMRHAITGLWADAWTWAPAGPGSKRGMARLHGKSPSAPIRAKDWESLFSDLLIDLRKSLPPGLFNRLEGIDMQNCLCECDKYVRCLEGGRAKQQYRNRTF